jgi:DNA-binding CsgD family transcriptional regulator
MLNYLIASIFLICCAIAAGTIFMLARLRKQYNFGFLSTLLFLLVFHFMFGFYSLWGQFIIAYLVKPYISAEVFTHVTDTAILLGFPFLVFAWLMLIRFSWEYKGKEISSFVIACFLILNTLIITALVFFLKANPNIGLQTLLKYYFILGFLVIGLIVGLKLMGSPGKASVQSHPGKIMGISIIVSAILQSSFLWIYSGNIIVALVFIFLFFAGIGFIPVYLNYSEQLSDMLPEMSSPASLDEFCKRFEVSPREKEIIIEVCNGLSNQQIADKLFISLQTVKDHTHRIYGKVDVGSRVQLIKLVGEIIKL